MDAQIIEGLKTFLSDTYILYIKTQNYHWNVEGPHFGPLHQMFEDQYTELREAVDDIAERIRALGDYAPGSCQEFNKYSKVTETPGRHRSAADMVADLARDHQMIAKHGREFIEEIQKRGDEPTAHFVIERVVAHEKTAWMLHSHSGN